jgi:hypothetical protein
MGLFDRVEARLERAVNGVFAKAFRAEVQPVEIASAIRRAMDDRAGMGGQGRSVVPNIFQIELSGTDFDRLTDFEGDLKDELVAAASEHADSQHYQPGGPFTVAFERDDDLETGVFRVRPATAKRPEATGSTGQSHAVPAPGGYAASPAPGAPDVDLLAGLGLADAVGPAAGPALGPVASAPVLGAGAAAAGELPRHTLEEAEPPKTHRVNPADRPWLDVDGERYPLMGALTILGRDDSADIVLDDPGISRRHSEIRVTTDGPHFVASIRDLGSTNGTYVNGDRITSQHLHDGDRVTVGRTSVIYRAGRR